MREWWNKRLPHTKAVIIVGGGASVLLLIEALGIMIFKLS